MYANYTAGRAAQHRCRHFHCDHVDIISGETITSPLQAGRIGISIQDRTDKAVETDYVKVEWIVRQTCKERDAVRLVCSYRERIRVRVKGLHRRRSLESSGSRSWRG